MTQLIGARTTISRAPKASSGGFCEPRGGVDPKGLGVWIDFALLAAKTLSDSLQCYW